MKNNSLLKSLLFIIYILIFITACNVPDDNIQLSESDEEPEQVEEISFSQGDIVLRIGTLPYRGAVLFIDYDGEIAISEYELIVDIALNDTVMQQDMLVEYVDGNLIAEIIDLMYLPGDELDFVLKIKEKDNEIYEYYHSEQLQRYPWKDWMLSDDEWFSVTAYSPNFKYNFPSCGNNLGAHSSWDIMTTTGKAVRVNSGTVGLVYRIVNENYEIYNPYVGAVVQYGHTMPVDGIYAGKIVMPGDHIGNVIPADRHIHYSIIRPLKYTKIDKNVIERFDYIPEELMGLYWCYLNQFQASVYDAKYYRDPFYFHEPTTLGYWYEETLPVGVKEEMLELFEKHNPNVTLPAKAPLE